tara:strand:- start:12706 stop:13119 length:414 start_codon:yes stop_codon:yes gene_type:complete
MMERTGQCLCGAVRYKLTGEPIATAVCHCKNCQRQSGSAFSLVVIARSSTVTIDGAFKTYLDTADSGANLERCFCPECGSALFSHQPATPGITVIKAGTFDDTTWLRPQLHIWCNSAQSWVEIPKSLPHFAGNAPTG